MIDDLDFRIIKSGTSDENAAFQIQEQHRKYFFVPESHFRTAVKNGLILGAFSGGEVVGYIWASRRNGVVHVRYLSVHRDKARNGIGRKIVEELKRRHADAFRIQLSCRTDYPGWKFWKGVDFRALRNRPGRAKSGSEVTDFICELSPLPLFVDLYSDDNRPKVAIDANVFFDLCDEHRPHHLESSGLLAEWVDAEFEICVTNAIEEDAARGEHDLNKYEWTIIKAPKEAFDCIHQQLVSLIGPGENEQDYSDRNHLSHAIADNVHAFVTRDEYLLENADKIYDQFGTSVLRPVDFVVNADSAGNQFSFDRRDLKSVRLSISQVDDRETISGSLQALIRQDEKVANLRARIRGWLAHPGRFEILSVLDEDGLLQALSVTEKSAGKVDVHLLRSSVRLRGTRKGRTILRCLANHLRAYSSQPTLVQVLDEVGIRESEDALSELGFSFHGETAFKVCLPGVWNLKEALEAANELALRLDGLKNWLGGAMLADCTSNALALLRLEHRLWPAKIRSGGLVQCVAIPIRPRWARALFDSNLGQAEFWDDDANLLMNPINAYYTGARPNIKNGRILWYVSSDENFPGSKRARAISQLTRRVIAPPLQSYREFRHFGVYRLADIEKLAGATRTDVVAMEFRDTELLASPVALTAIRDILNDPNQAFQWPTMIEEDQFLEIYQQGTN